MKLLFALLFDKTRRQNAKRVLTEDQYALFSYKGSSMVFKNNNADLFARYICRMASKNYIAAKRQQDRLRRTK